MGLLKRLLAKLGLGRSKPDPINVLEEGIEKLRVGIFARLYHSYALKVGENQARFLAAAVLNEALLESPGNDEAVHYYERHRTSISDNAMKLRLDPVLSEALSCLYAAQTLCLAYTTRNPFSERAQELGSRATKLSIHIPNTYELCGSGDANDCINAIARYADQFVQSATSESGQTFDLE